MNIKNCSICNAFNDDALVLKPFWSYSLGKKDYSTNKGKYTIGTKLIRLKTNATFSTVSTSILAGFSKRNIQKGSIYNASIDHVLRIRKHSSSTTNNTDLHLKIPKYRALLAE